MAGKARAGLEREVVVYKGITFYRYPRSRHSASRRYFTPGVQHRKRGVDLLHREIWKDHHGPIPAGHEIHHCDHNTLNNAPDNLECKTRPDHLAYHAEHLMPQQRALIREQWERVRVAAANWHGSDEGRAWHSELGKRSWEGREARVFTCEQCGEAFTSRKAHEVRFCSPKCRSAARRAAGADNEDRPCAWCAGIFTANRYSKARYCSRACAGRARRRG